MSENIGRILTYFDNQIDPEGINRLKFSLYPILKSQWKELQKCAKPSEIFWLLESSVESQERIREALKIFLFVLRAIGGKKRGKHCAQEAERILGPEFTPTLLNFSEQSREFQLFYWLLKIERHLPEECRESIIQQMARVGRVSHHLPEFEGLPNLFIRLYQDKELSEGCTGKLREALYKCKQSFSSHPIVQSHLKKCLSYLVQFQQHEDDPFSSGDDESTAQSMHESTNKGKREQNLGAKRRRARRAKPSNLQSMPLSSLCAPSHNSEKDSTDTPVPKDTESSIEVPSRAKKSGLTESLKLFHPAPSGDTAVSTTPSSPHSFLSDGSAINGENSADTGLPFMNSNLNVNGDDKEMVDPGAASEAVHEVELAMEQDTENSTTKSNGKEKVWMWLTNQWIWILATITILLVVTLFISVVGIPICNHFVWSVLNEQSLHEEVEHREGNTPVLAQFGAFFIEQLSVEQENKPHESWHKISVYLAESSCDKLPTATTEVHYNETDRAEKTDPLYMLKYSELELHACATTKKVESNPVMFFVLRTIENFVNFDPKQPNSHDYYKGIPVGTRGKERCTEVSYKVTEHDYYSVACIHPDDVTLVYNLTMRVRKVDINELANSTIIDVIDPESDDQEVEKAISFGSHQFCLFADIKESAILSTYNYTTLETHIEPRYNTAVAITVSSLVLLFVLVVAALMLMFKVVYTRCHRHSYKQLE